MPLDEYIEGGDGEREPGMEIRPDPAHDLLAMADQRQHRQHRLDEQAVLPLPALAEFKVRMIALRGMEGRVAQDNRAGLRVLPLKSMECGKVNLRRGNNFVTFFGWG